MYLTFRETFAQKRKLCKDFKNCCAKWLNFLWLRWLAAQFDFCLFVCLQIHWIHFQRYANVIWSFVLVCSWKSNSIPLTNFLKKTKTVLHYFYLVTHSLQQPVILVKYIILGLLQCPMLCHVLLCPSRLPNNVKISTSQKISPFSCHLLTYAFLACYIHVFMPVCLTCYCFSF